MNFNGKKMKSKRKALGLTLQEVADCTNSSKSHICELENKQSDPSGKKLILLSKVLEEYPEWFYDLNQLDQTKKVLGTLILWLAQSSTGAISISDAEALLAELNNGMGK